MATGGRFAHGDELTRLGKRSVALGVLDMVLSAHEWVHRRVEQLEIESATHALRRVSLDLTIPNPCGSSVTWFDGQRHPLIPLDVLAKRPLQRFSVHDGAGVPISTLTRRQNGELAWRGLIALASSSLSEIDQHPPEWAPPLLRRIAQDSPEDAAAALADLEHRANDDPIAEQLWTDAGLQTAMQMLSGNFLLIAMTDYDPGSRVILKYQHEVSLVSSADDQRTTAERRFELLGWDPTTIEVPVPSFTDCETFHFESAWVSRRLRTLERLELWNRRTPLRRGIRLS